MWHDTLIAVGQMGCLNSSNAYDQGACTYITNLKANVTVKQDFNLVHNLPIESGGYLSLQKESIHWPGQIAMILHKQDGGCHSKILWILEL